MFRTVSSLLVLIVSSGCGASDAAAPTARDVRAVTVPSADRSPNQGVTEISFEKWFVGYPAMMGNTSLGPRTFSGTLRSRVPFDNGVIVKLAAEYRVKNANGDLVFAALIDGTENLVTQAAVLDGVVTEGPMTGARAHVTFDVIAPCDIPGVTGTCFRGVVRIQPND